MNFDDFDTLNKTLNIETMQLEEKKTSPLPRLYVRGKKAEKQYVIRGSNRGGGKSCSYPWKDPDYSVGDWFWKPVSYEEYINNRSRPNTPSPSNVGGRVWRTSKAYREDTKQYGYYCERVA